MSYDNRDVLRGIDANEDAIIKGNEILSAVDANGDRLLSDIEVGRLAEQLTKQVQYNNELLTTLSSREESLLAMQKDVQRKQASLAQAMAVCDAKRAENAELKKKLAVAQDVAARASEEASNAKLDGGIKARESQALAKVIEDCKAEASAERARADLLGEKISSLEQELASARRTIGSYGDREAMRLAKHKQGYEEVSKELATMRAAHIPLKAELQRAAAQIDDLSASVRSLNRELASSRATGEAARARVEQLEDAQSNVRLMGTAMQTDLANARAECDRHRAAAEASQERVRHLETTVSVMQKEMQSRVEGAKSANAEVEALKGELEKVGSDLLALAHEKSAEKDHLESRIKTLNDSLRDLVDGSRAREHEHSEAMRDASLKLDASRQEAEEKYANLQEECQRLSELLQKKQSDSTNSIESFQAERDAFEARIAAAIAKQRRAEEERAAAEANAKAQATRLVQEVQSLRMKVTDRAGHHVQVMGALQSTIHQLRNECREKTEVIASLGTEMQRLLVKSEALSGIDAPMEEWHSDVQAAFVTLVDKNTRLRRRLEETKDKSLTSEIQRDEHRAKILLLEETRMKAEETERALRDEIISLKRLNDTRMDDAKRDVDAAHTFRAEQEAVMKRMVGQLEAANAQNRSLQEDNARLNNLMTAAGTKEGSRVAALEQQLEGTESELRTLITQRDALQAERVMMQKMMADTTSSVARLQKENQDAADRARDAAAKERDAQRAHDKKLMDLTETVRNYESQLAQTKNLLNIVQEQRRQLQTDNTGLRSELDGILRKSLAGELPGSSPVSMRQPLRTPSVATRHVDAMLSTSGSVLPTPSTPTMPAHGSPIAPNTGGSVEDLRAQVADLVNRARNAA